MTPILDERHRPRGCAGTLAVMLAVACCAGAALAQPMRLSFHVPKGTEITLDGKPVTLPAIIEIELLPYPGTVDPPEPPPEPPVDAISITPETIGKVEQSPEGKTYKLAPGTYRPIVLKDRKNVRIIGGEGVLFHGAEPTYYGSAIVLERCEGVHIEGVEATGGKAGIAIYRSTNCGATRCNLHNNKYWGFFASFASDCFCIECETHDNELEHGIYFSNDSHRPRIVGNHSHHNPKKSGIQCNGDKYAGGEGVIRGALIEGNRIHDCLIGMNLDGLVDSDILGNDVEEGLRLFKGDGAEASSRNTIKGNTIRIVNTKVHGIMLRNGAADNRIEQNVIELGKVDPWFFPISAERGCTFTSMGNAMSGPSTKPIGGGTWGKDGEDFAPGDTSTFVRVK